MRMDVFCAGYGKSDRILLSLFYFFFPFFLSLFSFLWVGDEETVDIMSK